VDNVFSLTYPEYVAAEALAEALPKRDYSVCIPLSRQQRGFDLLVYNLRNGNAASVQVKSSKSYDVSRHGDYDLLLWFKRFKPRGADFYALVGVYPDHAVLKHSLSGKKTVWSHVILLLPRDEASPLLRKIASRDKFFYVRFDLDFRRVDLTRPFESNWKHFLLDRNVESLRRHLDGR